MVKAPVGMVYVYTQQKWDVTSDVNCTIRYFGIFYDGAALFEWYCTVTCHTSGFAQKFEF